MAKEETTAIDIQAAAVDGWDFVITFANLGERNKFMAAAAKWQETGDSTPIHAYCAKFIRRWPYEGLNPSKVEDYDLLMTEQFDEEVVPRFTKALEAFRRK